MEKDYILLCDDNEEVSLITKFYLESENYEVETAKNTDDLFKQIEENLPSLIILDLNIPREGGEKVIHKLKSNSVTRNIPVILFSGKENLEEIATNLKAEGFLKKPFDLNNLMDVVSKYVSLKI